MTRHQLAQRESIYLFRSGQDVVAIATGLKPRNCKGPSFCALSKNRFAVNCLCPDHGEGFDGTDRYFTDRYFIVQPIAVPPEARRVGILHRDGTDEVDIEDLASAKAKTTVSTAILGISQDFSLEAAFKDALSKFDPEKLASPGLVEIVSMGALYGGFSGFSRLFVRVESNLLALRNSKGKI